MRKLDVRHNLLPWGSPESSGRGWCEMVLRRQQHSQRNVLWRSRGDLQPANCLLLRYLHDWQRGLYQQCAIRCIGVYGYEGSQPQDCDE